MADGKSPVGILHELLLGEIEACSSHVKHSTCNCRRATSSVLQRMENEGYMVFDRAGNQVVPCPPEGA